MDLPRKNEGKQKKNQNQKDTHDIHDIHNIHQSAEGLQFPVPYSQNLFFHLYIAHRD